MPSRPLQAISLVCILIALCIATACGGGSGGSGGGGGGGGVPDFSISIRPATVVVGQGGSVSTTVSITAVNGFGSQVSVGLSGFPVNVTASPSSFTVTATSSQVVTFSAASNATLGVATVAVSGTSSQTTHSSNLTLGVDSVATGMHPPSRTRYLRTDAQWDYSFINFFPQRWIIYDSASKRFFANNTTQNRIDVFDATTELQVGEIAVPQPWLSDETSDHSIIYVGTFLGDL